MRNFKVSLKHPAGEEPAKSQMEENLTGVIQEPGFRLPPPSLTQQTPEHLQAQTTKQYLLFKCATTSFCLRLNKPNPSSKITTTQAVGFLGSVPLEVFLRKI